MRKHAHLIGATTITLILLQSSLAHDLTLNIIHNGNFHAGFLSDNTLIATIIISNEKENCQLHLWEESSINELSPGRYSLLDTQTGRAVLNLKFKGDNWKPDALTGKGIATPCKKGQSHVYLLTDGDQNPHAGIWKLHISATYSTAHEKEKNNIIHNQFN